MRMPARQIILKQTILQDMHFHGHFELDPFDMNALEDTSEISLSLALHTAPYPSGSTVLPISGFPRRIMAEPGVGASSTASAGPGNLGMHRAPSKSSLNSSFHPTASIPPPPYIPMRTSSRAGNSHYPILTRQNGGSGGEAEKTSVFTNFSGKFNHSPYLTMGAVLGQQPQSIRN